ncbi:ubiquitin carboxyl-terminal hydrolase 15-like, partial [Limulus polyphemus]|uniref:ubiquitinyl hydrolase 1 n=1 Tax=Limulus polyphemus TaxID=6850 RepID=A0ABM1BUD8_LIMPO
MTESARTSKCSKSASEGDLADVEEGIATDINIDASDLLTDSAKIHTLPSGFFTLPRLMSGRKRGKKKKDKEEVSQSLTKSKTEPESLKTTKTKSKKEEAKKVVGKQSHGFFKRLFRRHLSQLAIPLNVSVTTGNTHACNSEIETSGTNKPKHPSTSNNEIRSQHLVCDSGTTAVSLSEVSEPSLKGKTPAVCGIHNHGNTCFMNAIIQCLNNTDMFAEYFVMNHYRVDLLRRNKIHAKKYGTKGEVTEQLVVLLKSIWTFQYLPEISNEFKTYVAKYGAQYEGSNQHDAQEFLLWLLDKVHEDLNTATKKNIRSQRFILQVNTDLMSLKLVLINECLMTQVKLGVSMDIHATVKEFRENLSKDHQIPSNQ